MITSRIGAIDALDAAIVGVNGIDEALLYRSSMEHDDMLCMLSEAASQQVEKMQEIRDWLVKLESMDKLENVV